MKSATEEVARQMQELDDDAYNFYLFVAACFKSAVEGPPLTHTLLQQVLQIHDRGQSIQPFQLAAVLQGQALSITERQMQSTAKARTSRGGAATSSKACLNPTCLDHKARLQGVCSCWQPGSGYRHECSQAGSWDNHSLNQQVQCNLGVRSRRLDICKKLAVRMFCEESEAMHKR